MKYRIEAEIEIKSYKDAAEACSMFMHFLERMKLPVRAYGTKVITDEEDGIDLRQFAST